MRLIRRRITLVADSVHRECNRLILPFDFRQKEWL